MIHSDPIDFGGFHTGCSGCKKCWHIQLHSVVGSLRFMQSGTFTVEQFGLQCFEGKWKGRSIPSGTGVQQHRRKRRIEMTPKLRTSVNNFLDELERQITQQTQWESTHQFSSSHLVCQFKKKIAVGWKQSQEPSAICGSWGCCGFHRGEELSEARNKPAALCLTVMGVCSTL